MNTTPLRQLFTAARKALAEFGLDGARLTPLASERNVVYRVDAVDGRRLVLRLRSPERFGDAAARVQLRWLERLGDAAPQPLRTGDGRFFTTARVGEQQWRIVCLAWVPGRTPRGAAFLKPVPLRAIGRAVAVLHQSAEKYRPKGRAACPRLDAEHFFGPHTCVGKPGRTFLSPRQHTLVRRAAGRIRRALRRTQDSPAHVGLIHGDLEPPNWVFRGGVPRAIDFDEFGVGPYLFDLLQVIWTHALWAEYPRFRADLLVGYESLRPLTDQDRRELDLYQAIPFIVWLNRGLKPDAVAQAEFGKCVGPTLSRVGELCAVS